MKTNKQQPQQTLGTIRDVLCFYREHKEREVADPVRLNQIVNHLLGFVNTKPLSWFTLERQKEYARIRKVAPPTIRREFGTLVAAYKFAELHNRIPTGTHPHIQLPAKNPPKDLWLTKEELMTFLQAAQEQYGRGSALHRFVVICAYTASRKQAVMDLTWDAIDWESGMIHFQQGVGIQTKKRKVPVPMSNALKLWLLEWRTEGDKGRVVGDTNTVDKPFNTLKTRLGGKYTDVTPHTLRHTWATLAARAGVDLWKIAGVLGDTMATVEKNYLHHCPDHLREAVNHL